MDEHKEACQRVYQELINTNDFWAEEEDNPTFYHSFGYHSLVKAYLGKINMSDSIFDVYLTVDVDSYSNRTNNIGVEVTSQIRNQEDKPNNELPELFNPIRYRKIPYDINMLFEYGLTCLYSIISINRVLGKNC